MYGRPLTSGVGFMALRRAERRAMWRRRFLAWSVSAAASGAFLALWDCLGRAQ